MGMGFGEKFIVLFLLVVRTLFAVDILDTAENIFFNPNDPTRIGIEVEFKNLNLDEASQIIKRRLGGTLYFKEERQLGVFTGFDEWGNEIFSEIKSNLAVLEGTSIGQIIIKTDFNQTTDRRRALPEDAVLELITEPISLKEVHALASAVNDLKANGAVGTEQQFPVSIQVNTEIGGGQIENINSSEIVNLLRSYMAPKHRSQISAHLQIPDIRKKYLKSFSKGFLKRLLDPSYNPTLRELYDDYIYRQSLELLGDKRAWSSSVEEVRTRLLNQEHPIVPVVVKLNPIRISSLLMFAFPKDPMSKLYRSSGWAKPLPLIEFREWNNDFDVKSCIKQALGLINAAKHFGYYDHDKLLSKISGLDEVTIRSVRRSVNEKNRKGSTIFRYFLGSPDTVDVSLYREQARYYQGTQVGFLPSNSFGFAPMQIPGESVVFHRRHFHRFNVLGKYNPTLINVNLQQALENKYVEYLFWNEYVSSAMPKTFLLSSLIDEGKGVRDTQSHLNTIFPNGWVMKGVWDLGSETDIITNDTNLDDELRNFQVGSFLLFKENLEKGGLSSTAPEELIAQLRSHPHYKGWVISERLKNSHLTLIQERVEILHEFRVEVISGRVLGNGSTMVRYQYLYQHEVGGRKKEDYVSPPLSLFKRAEEFTQSIVDNLPPEFRGIPFGMDVAYLKDGRFIMIESNPGGNSNFLFEEEKESVLALTKFLKSYPKFYKSGSGPNGLTDKEQMQYLKDQFLKWGIDTNKLYPGMTFLEDHIEDKEFAHKPFDFTDVKMDPLKEKQSCVSTLWPQGRRKRIA